MSRPNSNRSSASRGGRQPSKAWLDWKAEIDGVKQFLRNLKGSSDPNTARWRQGMKKHYTSRLAKLRRMEPKKYN